MVVCTRAGIVGRRYGSPGVGAGWLPGAVQRELRSDLRPFCFVSNARVLREGETHTRRVAYPFMLCVSCVPSVAWVLCVPSCLVSTVQSSVASFSCLSQASFFDFVFDGSVFSSPPAVDVVRVSRRERSGSSSSASALIAGD